MIKKTEELADLSPKGDREPALKSAAEIALERSHASVEEADKGPSSSKELESLRSKTAEQAAKARENWDRLLRVQADFDNYKKRVSRERQELLQSANEKLLVELFIPLDHFEMGLEMAQQSQGGDSMVEGMKIVLGQFKQFLKDQGVTEIQAVGQPFDPAIHEAVSRQESEAPEGQVIQQTRKGYRLRNKVIRPAAVMVSAGKQPAPSA